MRLPLALMRFWSPEGVEDTAPVDSDGIPNLGPSGPGFLGLDNRSDNASGEPATDEPEPTEAAPDSEATEGRPDTVPDSETTDPKPEQKADEAAEGDEAPEAATEGEPDESAGKPNSETVAKLLKRYGGDANRVGSAYLHLQSHTGRTEAENAKLREQLDALTTVDGEGNIVVRPDAAARALASQRGRGQEAQAPDVSDDEIRQQVTEEYRQMLSDEHWGGPDELDDNLRKVQPLIDKAVQDRVRVRNQDRASAAMRRAYEASKVVKDFFSAHPEAENYTDAIDKWYASFPEDMRHEVLRYMPLENVYRAVKLQEDLPKLIEEIWSEAVKHATTSVRPTDGGTPQGGEHRSKRTRQQAPDDDAGFFEPQSVLDKLLAAK